MGVDGLGLGNNISASFRGLGLLVVCFFGLCQSAVSQQFEAALVMQELELASEGSVSVVVGSDDIDPVPDAIYQFVVNDYSMFEPLRLDGGEVSKISADGSFSVIAPFPLESVLYYLPLSGNDSICRLELLDVQIGDSVYPLNAVDSTRYFGPQSRHPFIRPDGYGLVYPNPITNNVLSFELESDYEGDIQMDIITPSGRQITGGSIPVIDKRKNTYTIEMPDNMASGNYFVTLISKYGSRRYLVTYRR